MAKTFNDPLFASQWYLLNTGQRGGSSRLDINVLSAWDRYTGKGVIVSVNDDGMDLTHPAMVANLRTDLAFDSVRGTTGQGFQNADSSHGTVVGSIVSMAGNDGIGGVGVAYDARIVPGLAVASGANVTNLFLANLAAGAGVSVNSWGKDPAFAENFGASGSEADREWGAALIRAATDARGGLGLVIEVSGGNERGNNADTALSNFTGNKLTIAVGAITETGAATDYSTRGASLLVTAPGGVANAAQSVDNGFGIPSADLQGTAGYNQTSGVGGDYAFQNQGTSYSGPMVGGAAALMLEANPRLGFRDVSSILALTARKVDVNNSSWVQTGTTDWNLGSMHFSRDFGFGLIDVSAAVRLAESWVPAAGTMANWQSAEGVSTNARADIPDSNPQGLSVSANVSGNVLIERMEFDLNLEASNPSQLSATIMSPNGTTVTLFDQPLTRNLVNGAPDMNALETVWPSTFTIGSTAFLGETSAGTWTLRLTDKVSDQVATYNSLTVRAWGSTISSDSQYVFTNEFGGLATNPTLTDSSGLDTLNAAALETAVRLDLVGGNRSSVGTGEFTVAVDSIIENAIGGLSGDTLIGNTSRNVLRGNAGDDALFGAGGIDSAVYVGARSTHTVVKTVTGWTVSSSLEGTDTLTDVERIRFTDKILAVDINGNAGQAYRVYQAAFNRTPDNNGLKYWIEQMDAGTSLSDVAAGFVSSAEFQGLYGANPTNADFLSKLYNNVLHRTPDQGGYDWWLGELNANRYNKVSALASFSESPENQAGVIGVIQNGIELLLT